MATVLVVAIPSIFCSNRPHLAKLLVVRCGLITVVVMFIFTVDRLGGRADDEIRVIVELNDNIPLSHIPSPR